MSRVGLALVFATLLVAAAAPGPAAADTPIETFEWVYTGKAECCEGAIKRGKVTLQEGRRYRLEWDGHLRFEQFPHHYYPPDTPQSSESDAREAFQIGWTDKNSVTFIERFLNRKIPPEPDGHYREAFVAKHTDELMLQGLGNYYKITGRVEVRVYSEEDVTVTWELNQDGKGEETRGWFPFDLFSSSAKTTGSGRFVYRPANDESCVCGQILPRKGVRGNNVIEHVDERVGADSHLKLKVTGGVGWYLAPGYRYYTLRLDVRVVESNIPERCPVGATGEVWLVRDVLLIYASGFDDNVKSLMRVCKQVHEHTWYDYEAGEGNQLRIRVDANFPTRTAIVDRTPTEVRFGVDASDNTRRGGRSRLVGSGIVSGPAARKLSPVGDVIFEHTDAKGDQRTRLRLIAAWLQPQHEYDRLAILAREEGSGGADCRRGYWYITLYKRAGLQKAKLECASAVSSHAHTYGIFGSPSPNVDVRLTIKREELPDDG